MSDHTDNGGAAFPGPSFTSSGHKSGHDMGMTLRDWFAGQSLSQAVEDYGTPGIRGREEYGNRIVPYSSEATGLREEIIARQAYAYADAMIRARKGGDV